MKAQKLLTFNEIKDLSDEEKVDALEKAVNHHNKLYFVDNAAVIPDEEFDLLTEALRELKPDSPALFELVGDIGEIEHPVPMLSLDKRYTYEDIKQWVNDVGDEKYLVEPKYDGMSARYQSGTLSTRGDGYHGENISERLPYLKVVGNLPKTDESAYGEIVVPLDYFNKNLKGPYKNTRGAAVGIIKSKDINPAGIKALREHGVHFVLHDQAKRQEVSREDLLNEDQWQTILEEMFHSEYPLDGIVIKAINPEIKARLGRTQHHDKWAVAYKSPAERKITHVLDIKDQVGRTGRITSVAVLEPVELSGATVTNVTLHNYKYLEDCGIDIGSEVEVCRSGEVIPFITRVISSPNKKSYQVPEICPVCGNPLKRSNKYLECTNVNCPARLTQSIEYFFKVLGVEELGLKTIERLINEFKLKSIFDFYKLKAHQIAELDGFGIRSAQVITQNIQYTLYNSTPEKLLQALGIKNIGSAASNWIINEFGFDNLNSLTFEDLEKVKGLGPIKAANFIKEVKKKWPLVEKLMKLGLTFKKVQSTVKLNGLSFAITGKKGQYSRDELVKMIQENGGEYKTAITKGLTYLIAGEDAGSKLQKAADNDVKVITEQDFLKLIQ